MRAYERFLKYVTYNTQSNENTGKTPSTEGQRQFAQVLQNEMKEIGIEDVHIDEFGYIYGTIPATHNKKEEPVIGLIAHMDTAPSMCGENITPRVIKYEGGDILLNKEKGIIMSEKEFPHLSHYIGQELIVTDGTTLLGADDKAGISEIITMAEQLIREDNCHGEIRIAFTPDEEIGEGANHFNIEEFGADFAYTVDGGTIGELEYENFNAASAIVRIHGINIHPGEAKNKMRNANLVAMEFNRMIPAHEVPECTEGYEGFYHLCEINGTEENSVLKYIIRDHDMEKFEQKKQVMYKIASFLNDRYGSNTVELEMNDSYYNMKEKIEPCMHIVERADHAMRNTGIMPIISPIRGGTDGARLSFEGLPCPNLSTGGHNFHGRYEYIPVTSMDKMVEVLLEIVRL